MNGKGGLIFQYPSSFNLFSLSLYLLLACLVVRTLSVCLVCLTAVAFSRALSCTVRGSAATPLVVAVANAHNERAGPEGPTQYGGQITSL